MFYLSLRDSNQVPLVNGTLVYVSEGIIVIVNSNFEKRIRLPNNNFTSGNIWIDSAGKTILVELFLNGDFICLNSISLGSDFEMLFPNALTNWGAYFFKLHYSF
jgi:hypothetical protein